MISREDAKDRLFDFMPKGMTMKNISFELAIDEIFDSIGSCSECKHGLASGRGRKWLACKGGKIHLKDFFCADFERKEDENITK